jgi:hypothetical protein
MAQQQQMKVTASSNVQLLQQQQYHHSQQRGPGPMGHPYHFQSQQHLAASARLPLPHGGRNGHDYGGYIGGGGYEAMIRDSWLHLLTILRLVSTFTIIPASVWAEEVHTVGGKGTPRLTTFGAVPEMVGEVLSWQKESPSWTGL